MPVCAGPAWHQSSNGTPFFLGRVAQVGEQLEPPFLMEIREHETGRTLQRAECFIPFTIPPVIFTPVIALR